MGVLVQLNAPPTKLWMANAKNSQITENYETNENVYQFNNYKIHHFIIFLFNDYDLVFVVIVEDVLWRRFKKNKFKNKLKINEKII